MNKDYLDQLGELALGSRLKRMSDRMLSDAASVYQHFNLDIQPKWFGLLALLYDQQQASVVEAAQRLGLTQPAISQFCRQLQQQGYVEVTADEQDSRKKIMGLTDKGFSTVSEMQPIWQAVRRAAEEMCRESDNAFFAALQRFEAAHQRSSLLERTLAHYEEQQNG